MWFGSKMLLLFCSLFSAFPHHFVNPPAFHFTYQDKSWFIPFTEVGFDGIDPTTVDYAHLTQLMEQRMAKEIEVPAKSAKFEDRKPVPHQQGMTIHYEQTLAPLKYDLHGSIQHPIPIITRTISPPLTVQQLVRLKEKKLAEYTTFFRPSNVNRTHNIKLSSKAIDHKVVMPGEIFSFNKTVGIRTTQRGYRYAKIIVRGEYSEGVGGGICQTSSTLFNAVDKAGLKIIQQISHSRNVPYVPKGRDATVSWGGPDFRFQNDRSTPILIVSDVYKGAIRIAIYGYDYNQIYPNS